MHLKIKHFRDISKKYSHMCNNLQFCVKIKIVNAGAVYMLSNSHKFIFSPFRLFNFNNLRADIFGSSINYYNVVSYFNSISSRYSI